ncbi:MAG: 30S ribosomal protein S17 [Candidatus Bathyarchaeia archaeon]
MSRESCGDRNCPVHGTLSVRGRVFEGKVASAKAKNTIVVEREHYLYVPKYLRYERRHSRIPAHLPPCMKIREGDRVRIAECRPISKTVSFVVLQRMEGR